MGGGADFVLTAGSLDHVPTQYFAALRMKPSEVAKFQREAFARHPSVVVINAADVIEIIQQVIDQIALVVRFISGLAILAGIIILASSVAATRFRRLREVAILKTLGATRHKIAMIFSVEFLILGAAGGLLGSLLAAMFSNVLLVKFLDVKIRIDALPILAAIALSALTANLAGWLTSARVISHKPLSIIRQE